jgi:hypothetical protein
MSQLVSNLENAKDPDVKLSGQELAQALFRGRLVPGKAWQRNYYRLKFLLRHLTTRAHSGPWLDYLAQCPLLEQMLNAQPGLPCKLHRPYLAANINHQQRLAALTHHYTFMQSQLPRRLLDGHLSRDGARLASIEARNDQHYHLRLCSLDQMNREGEVTLSFTDDQDAMLAAITFVIRPEQGATLFIGGLQGPRRQCPHEAIHSATKACHGLFPKRLALEALTQLAAKMGVQQILAVGNQTHMYQDWRYFYKSKSFLHADYDKFWLSMNGQLQEQGYFRLPSRLARKPMEQLPSKKRAEYRRRYALLDRLADQVMAHFQ